MSKREREKERKKERESVCVCDREILYALRKRENVRGCVCVDE